MSVRCVGADKNKCRSFLNKKGIDECEMCGCVGADKNKCRSFLNKKGIDECEMCGCR
ncbi:hypothetical protein CWI39_2638p0010 [Hamiltosporidium magnivora]|uniref:Uncharacterized protein n=1 Tax=Hamiltosporidium magnivora TaxID=148818 RepID=A0A4Q9KUP9_9MICR|nr:hypothetical protein CWI39_2638p0010 [Hamiltosporidium magnivora]